MVLSYCSVVAAYLLYLEVLIPIRSKDRQDISNIHLTSIGEFGLIRKGRPKIPSHYHTGIDIQRPEKNYDTEPIFPIAKGIIISKRTDGPYANLIIEHNIKGSKIWTLYEHIAGIKVNVGNQVDTNSPIARFMNKGELDQYGWQFDHFHLEILKVKPLKIKPTNEHPERFFNSYTLSCYSINDLNKYYIDPVEYFKSNLH